MNAGIPILLHNKYYYFSIPSKYLFTLSYLAQTYTRTLTYEMSTINLLM